MQKCENCSRSKHRTEDEKKYLQTRLKTIEGQVRGVSKMIDDDKYCNDVLTQLLAINKSIRSLSNDILKSHLSTCVVDDIKGDKLEVLDEVMELIGRLN
ncbi:MAG: metal-sensing transcriptional repressor [Bacilli bacterium]|nr:metal-sensing transcriptional repressor [Bacilli bacterium]